MKSTIIFWLALSSPVYAQTTSWTNTFGLHTVSTCVANGETWEELGATCHADKIFRQRLDANSVIGTSGVTVTNTPPPKCPEGYSLVYTGRAMCARDLIEPQ